ncbi:hypothetical protein GALMADRAFT_1027004 [Galerina marginata CBS 339.88]|uniref:F-box domain-containing protein n=1 Tax=Galerina marginata (strain CBS 339.88) TaxID=685588 RepID=A0A067SCT5_GALM3|nr:hypothetical protein GALMADRAFT_1027004 [Galerina marginata CBS 339.88]
MEQKTEMEIPALVTLRYFSQVCSRWRELAVGSPSLWAHVLNFNFLQQKVGGQHWGKEVILRSGTAHLHVRATNVGCGGGFLEQVFSRVGSLFNQPNPVLKPSSSISPGRTASFGPEFVLFANNGPLLRTLSARGLAHD